MTYADAGSRHTIRVADEVAVTLPETPTTGFRWQAEVDGSVLRQIGDATDVGPVTRGAGGSRTVAFQALRPGLGMLRLAMRRPWESEPTDQFVVELEIGPVHDK